MCNYYILDEYTSNIEIEKSQFISLIFPISSTFDIKDKIKEIKLRFPKATHYIYAIKTSSFTKSNDDGEPAGTCGRPTLELLDKTGLNDVCVITIRYYGGIKLGAGRLLRTYVASANEVIKKAVKYTKIYTNKYEFEVLNSKRNIFEYICRENGIKINILEYNGECFRADIILSNEIPETLKNLDGIRIVSKTEILDYKGVK
ncbi:MAG: YigZ family protein [Bacilli bacterium]